MAKKSMIEALLNQDKKNYYYGMMLPFKRRTGMDPDQLSTDYMKGDLSPAVPGIVADWLNSMVKGSQMMKGERPIDPDEITKIATEFLPGALAASAVNRAGMKGAVLGANVFQGGPHKYGHEGAAKSLEHIGKGEGAQAYGWGRYDTDLPEVAQVYKKQAPYQDIKRSFLKELPEDAEIEDVMSLLGKGHFSESQERVIRALNDDDWLEMDYPAQAISAIYSKNIDNFDPSDALRRAVDDAGHLYKHDLRDEDIARYLDWDKPLIEQPESVRAALAASLSGTEMNNITGQQLYERLSSKFGDEGASKALNRVGIPGLKYKDAMSRVVRDNQFQVQGGKQPMAFSTREAAEAHVKVNGGKLWDTGTGTHNYVTWDQDVLDRMKLLERDNVKTPQPMALEEPPESLRKLDMIDALARSRDISA
jgi:hypothetical protein